MKKSFILIFSFIASTSLLHGQVAEKKPVYRDAATHETLLLTLRKADENDPIKALEKSEGTDPTKENQPQNLIESSDLISYMGLTTLVPKRAILKLPEVFKDRINNHPSGNRIVGWLDFYTANRGWITTVEVTRAQAGGREKIDQDLSEQLDKSKNMVVTVLDSGPISSTPFREEETEKTSIQ